MFAYNIYCTYTCFYQIKILSILYLLTKTVRHTGIRLHFFFLENEDFGRVGNKKTNLLVFMTLFNTTMKLQKLPALRTAFPYTSQTEAHLIT